MKPNLLFSVTLFLLLAAAGHAGQRPPATDRDLYTAAVARDQDLRAAVDQGGGSLKDYRAAVSAYDTVVRLYPRSGYVDNALWQGAGIAVDAFDRYGQERDRSTARRMLRLLVSDYPASRRVAAAREALQRLDPPPAAAEKPVTQAPASAGDLYTAAEAREQDLRAALDQGGGSLKDYRAAVSAYDTVVRLYPRSGYVDNALWQGAGIAVDAFDRYGQERDRSTARRMLRLLVSDYPASRLVAAASEALQRLDPPPAAVEKPVTQAPAPPRLSTPPPVPVPAPKAIPAPPPSGGPVSLARQLGLGASKIVIDPGHGGHDPGALGAGLSEAAVVLDIALQLESLLTASGFEVVLTRRSDTFVPLEERTLVATRERADLFLSIHVNASRVRSARGVESYFLNFASDEDAEAVAARENASTDYTMNRLPGILRAIALSSKRDESRSLAAAIQRSLVSQLKPANTSLRDNGVKQAPFVVLIGADMPSVLVEVAFLTHAQEGRLLKTRSYRQRIAQALFVAVRGYQKSLKNAAVLPAR